MRCTDFITNLSDCCAVSAVCKQWNTLIWHKKSDFDMSTLGPTHDFRSGLKFLSKYAENIRSLRLPPRATTPLPSIAAMKSLQYLSLEQCQGVSDHDFQSFLRPSIDLSSSATPAVRHIPFSLSLSLSRALSPYSLLVMIR